jgi:C1A family cysteine protease
MPNEEFSVAKLQQILNESGAQWEAGTTRFSELPPEQKRHLLGYEPGPSEESLEQRIQASQRKLAAAKGPAVGYPASYDLRSVGGKNFVTPVKDQGQCGSCVAFGTAATVEGTFRVQRGDPNLVADLSEASLFFCIGPNANAGRCPQGGWNVSPALDALKNTGVPDEACFPYTDQDQPCHQCADWRGRAIKITGWHSIDTPAEMKQWLSTRGPLVTCFTVYDDFFAYRSGVYSHKSGNWDGGHCVSCVGYNDAGGYWICKNSWGTGFGESGYFRIAYGEVGIDSTMWAVEGIQVELAFSGVWRAGSDAYYLWVNANWDNFRAKWEELSKQNLRLVDLESYTLGGGRVWAGVWRAGSDAHYLWVNASWDNFRAKWEELAKQNLRLTVLTTYEQGGTTRYAGVWRAGSDAYYLWVNANWDNFRAKWEELSKQNLRLVDLESYTLGGGRVWAGVWRAGSDAHYLWVNASWDNFRAKWEELAKQNLRLTVLTTYEQGGTTRYAGVWRAGSDPYYLWANASWDNFRAKWEELGKQNLRLIHLKTFEAGMTAKAGGSDSAEVSAARGDRAGDAGSVSVGEGRNGGGAGQVGGGEGQGGEGQGGEGEGGGSSDVGQLGGGEGEGGGSSDVGQVGGGEGEGGGSSDVGQLAGGEGEGGEGEGGGSSDVGQLGGGEGEGGGSSDVGQVGVGEGGGSYDAG